MKIDNSAKFKALMDGQPDDIPLSEALFLWDMDGRFCITRQGHDDGTYPMSHGVCWVGWNDGTLDNRIAKMFAVLQSISRGCGVDRHLIDEKMQRVPEYRAAMRLANAVKKN